MTEHASAVPNDNPDRSAAELQRLFDSLPVAVFIEDLSAVRAFLKQLRSQGVRDVRAHFEAHPADLTQCVSMVKILDVNDATLDLYRADSKTELLQGLDTVFSPESQRQFSQALLEFADGEHRIRFEAVNQTLDGEEIHVDMNIVTAPGHERDWARVYVVATDISQRWSAAHALEESERRYRSLVEDQPELVCRFRPDGRLTYVNRAYARYFGKMIEECEGFDLFLLLPEEDRPALRRHLDSFGPEQQVSRIEHQVRRADGSLGWMQWTDRAILDRAGAEVVEFQSVGVDLTDLKEAQQRLAESETRFRSIFEYAGVGIGLLDVEGNILQANRAFERILAAEDGTLNGRAFWTLAHRQDAALHEECYRDLLAGRREQLRLEARFIGADDRTLWGLLTASLLHDRSEEPHFVLAMLEDTTERKTMESRLRASEERFREISDNIREVFWLFDWLEQRVIYVSPAFEKIWGRSVTSLYEDYSQWGDSIIPEDREAARQSFEQILETGGGKPREYRIARPDGEIRWISDRGSAIRNEQGDVVRVTGIAEDVTERKRIEAERRRLEVQVRESQKLESLGLLAGGVAHDFNNLLMGVLGNADLALTTLPSSSPAWVPLQNIEATARRAADLANQMLAYSGKGRFLVETVDLSKLVEEMASLAGVSVTKKTSVHFSLASDLPGIEADVTQVRQVVLNLITNAAEAIGAATGRIEITTGVATCNAEYLAQIMAAEDIRPGRFVYVEIADTGVGMSEEVRKRIFDPFFTTKFTGRGLGMAAVLGIMRGHGGAVSIESQPGRGTSIRILFPASNAPKAVRSRPGDTESQQWKGEGTVLLVDDEPVVRTVAQRMLEHLGFGVIVASDGREALDLFREHAEEIRLVILDLAMPEIGGEEAFEELRRIKSDIPVIMSSGYNEQEVSDSLAGQGLTAFIQKPYRLGALQSTLRAALEEPQDD